MVKIIDGNYSIVDSDYAMDECIKQVDELEGELFARKKTESVIMVSTKADYAEDAYVEMFLSAIDSTEDSGEFLLYSVEDDIYIKNKVMGLSDGKGCVLYVEFINPAVTGKETRTSFERDGVIYDVGVQAGSALYYLQKNNGKMEYCPIMRTDLDLSTPETKGVGELSGMGEMERVEHENYNIYENEHWNRGFFAGEELLPNSVESGLYFKYFGGNQPNPHFHFMTIPGLIPYVNGWSKHAEGDVTPGVNSNAISVENLKNYILDVSDALNSGDMDVFSKTLRECDLGLPYLSMLQNNKLQSFNPNLAGITSGTLMGKISEFVPKATALKGKKLSFKEKSAASLGVKGYIEGKGSFKEIIESLPEYDEIKKRLAKNANPVGVDAMVIELDLAGLFDKLYRIIAVTNFANVSEQENCKKNIKRIVSNCMNDVAMPFARYREKSIWDIYDKGFDNPNIKVNEI